MQAPEERSPLLSLASKIVSAYVENNRVANSDLPQVIQGVYEALAECGEAPPAPPKPAVPINKSVTPEFIICLEDGRQLKMLKRHLRTVYNLSPEDYRKKWGLKPDYPMVAPAYANARRRLASRSASGAQGRRRGQRHTD